MKTILCTRIIDDKGIECKEGDDIIIQTKEMTSPLECTIKEIYTKMIVVMFKEIIYGYSKKRIKIDDVLLCIKKEKEEKEYKHNTENKTYGRGGSHVHTNW